MGDQPEAWLLFRTEPLVAPLNVAELIESEDQHPGLLSLDAAIAAVEDRYMEMDDDRELEAFDAEVDAVIARYTGGYRSYVERFKQAVQAAAADLGLPVRVAVKVDDDPHSAWWTRNPAVRNPAASGGDLLIFELWSNAHDAVELPNVAVRLDRSIHQIPSMRGVPRAE